MNTSTSHEYIFQTHIYQIIAIISAFVVLVLASTPEVQAISSTNKSYSPTMPIDIISDQMEASKDSSMIEFLGNVIATQGDMEIRADSIKVFFYSTTSSSSEKTKQTPEIREIISSGNVQCLTNERKAFADQAIFKSNDQTIVMTGKMVKLLEGGNEVKGQKLTLFMEQDRAVMESFTGRVRAFFAPSKPSVSDDNP